MDPPCYYRLILLLLVLLVLDPVCSIGFRYALLRVCRHCMLRSVVRKISIRWVGETSHHLWQFLCFFILELSIVSSNIAWLTLFELAERHCAIQPSSVNIQYVIRLHRLPRHAEVIYLSFEDIELSLLKCQLNTSIFAVRWTNSAQ